MHIMSPYLNLTSQVNEMVLAPSSRWVNENWRGWTVRLEPRSVWVMACTPSHAVLCFSKCCLVLRSDHVRTYTVSPHHLTYRPSPAASLPLYSSRGFVLSSPFCSETPEWLPTANGLVIWLLLGPSKSVLDLPFHPIPCFPYYTVFYHMSPHRLLMMPEL